MRYDREPRTLHQRTQCERIAVEGTRLEKSVQRQGGAGTPAMCFGGSVKTSVLLLPSHPNIGKKFQFSGQGCFMMQHVVQARASQEEEEKITMRQRLWQAERNICKQRVSKSGNNRRKSKAGKNKEKHAAEVSCQQKGTRDKSCAKVE